MATRIEKLINEYTKKIEVSGDNILIFQKIVSKARKNVYAGECSNDELEYDKGVLRSERTKKSVLIQALEDFKTLLD